MRSYPFNNVSCDEDSMAIDAVGANVNAIPAHVAPSAVPPPQAIEPTMHNDRNNITKSGIYGAASHNAVAAPTAIPSFFENYKPAPQHAEGAPNATRAFEAGRSPYGGASDQGMSLDGPVQTRDHARYEPDEVLAGEGSVVHGTPTLRQSEQAYHNEGPKENRVNDDKQSLDRSSSPPAGDAKHDEGEDNGPPDNSGDDSSDDHNGHGGRSGAPGLANRQHINPHVDSHVRLHVNPPDTSQNSQTPRKILPVRSRHRPSSAAQPSSASNNVASVHDPAESIGRWHPNALPGSLSYSSTSLIQQSTPSTGDGRQNENSKHAGGGKHSRPARTLVENYNDSGDDADDDGPDDGADDEEGDDGEGDEDQDQEDEGRDDESSDGESPDEEVSDEEAQVGDAQTVEDQGDISKTSTERHKEDERIARPGTAPSSDNEEDDSDYVPEDSEFDASQSGSESEDDGSDFSLSDNEVQDVKSAPIHGEGDSDSDSNSDIDSESAVEHRAEAQGELETERRVDSNSRADDEWESDSGSDGASESASASDNGSVSEDESASGHEWDVVSNDDSDFSIKFSSSSESEADAGSKDDLADLLEAYLKV